MHVLFSVSLRYYEQICRLVLENVKEIILHSLTVGSLDYIYRLN